MANKLTIDATGLKCPRPILMIMSAVQKGEAKEGDLIEVVADCANFKHEVKVWCDLYKKVLVYIRDEENGIARAQIQV